METFNYTYPIRVHFGKGTADKVLKEELKRYGTRVMLAYGGGSIKRTGLYDHLKQLLKEAGKEVIDFGGIMSNPTYAKVQEGARIARENRVDLILAVGGGSVSDCCKVVSAQALIDEDLWTLEYDKKQQPTKFLPMGVVVTAGGTGSEENNGAVITHEEKKIKGALWGALADFVVLDSDLTLTVPMKQVISGAFDTLSHCMETYFGGPHGDQVNVIDEMNESVQRNIIRNIRALIKNPNDDYARGELLWDAAIAENGMLKIGKVTDFQCHMIEHQLGAYTNCNHGAGLAVIHPVVYRHIYKSALPQFARFAREVWGISADGKSEVELAKEGVEALADFIREIGMPTRLDDIASVNDDLLQAVADSAIITPGCCKQLSRNEIFDILKECE
ncbi:MAG: iron-containing alcohol dehydrogenase [Prevotella sp.]|jgi:alcohol dehydrogenase YqhD (iron-dependent ADH family)